MTIAAVSELPVEQDRGSAQTWLPPLVAITIFATLSLISAVTSEGFLEADSCSHYLYARFAFREPHHFVNVWGRPLCTGLYAVPALIGERVGVRVMSLILALTCALVAMRVARLQNYRWPVLALIFTLAQPLVFLHSFTELTELPFATVIILALWAYRARLFWLMAALVAISPLGRPEGFGFLGLAGLALILHRRWYYLPILIIPLIGWNYAGWILYGRHGVWWQWLRDNWPYAAESMYDKGHLLHFVLLMPVVTSPLIFPATVLGLWRSLAPAWPLRRWLTMDHGTRCQVLIAVLPVCILFGHSVLYWLGKMASNGELRYMLVVAPFWGLLSAKGWEWVFDRLEWHRPLAWAGAASLAVIGFNFAYPVVPLVYMQDWKEGRTIARWIESSSIRREYPMLMGSHPAIWYFLDSSQTDPGKTREWKKNIVADAPPGTLLIWDPIYGVFNSDTARSITEKEIRDAGWVEIPDLPDGVTGEWLMFHSPDDAASAAPTSRTAAPP